MDENNDSEAKVGLFSATELSWNLLLPRNFLPQEI